MRSGGFSIESGTCRAPSYHAQPGVARNVKAAMGQALVQQYFEYAGWAVWPVGIETIGAPFLRDLDLEPGDLSAFPDLLAMKPAHRALNPITRDLGQAFFVEVKTWRDWIEHDFSRYARFGNVLVAWVGPRGMQGAWLTSPADDDRGIRDPRHVREDDFVALHRVGVVSIAHCDDEVCEARTRHAFDEMARRIAAM